MLSIWLVVCRYLSRGRMRIYESCGLLMVNVTQSIDGKTIMGNYCTIESSINPNKDELKPPPIEDIKEFVC